MDACEYYLENGYVIFRGLVPHRKIDDLLDLYKSTIVPSPYPFFRQNTNKYEKNAITEHGYVRQSFLDIHDYAKFLEFSHAAREIYASGEMRDALQESTGFPTFNLMQSMLFDANTETVPHQDWWYLDSVPNGHLLACWIALEDIDERAGRFYVIPKSMQVDLHSDLPNLSHSRWLARIDDYFRKNQASLRIADLYKGDVLFWNSRVIHGSLPTIDPAYSRKSITGHYLPSQYEFGNLFTTKKFVNYKIYNGMNFYRNQPDYSVTNSIKSKIKQAAYNSPRTLRALRQVQRVIR
ncbi:MAG TPA: phytanoyl-CoA dioxygenase family protein [Burkholderiales bacterium]|jgi:phytanoyl-CoA hydroxylase|nr:phytanoyl-CoA dioxygenase family protein [Burkholderiales bacterium]